MREFNQVHMDHIKEIFTERTGVSLPRRRRRRLGTVALLAAALALCLGATVAAASLFSSLEEDQLSLTAVYQGDGVVTVEVENRSDKALRFQPVLRLTRWRTGEAAAALGGQPVFTGTEFAPHSAGTMTIDLSAAYDLAALETPLEAGDWYCLVLTNNGFAFGQDWTCAVDFAPPLEAPPAEPLPPARANGETLARIRESLRPYFEDISFDTEERSALNEAYMDQVRALLADFDGTVVPSVSPWLLVDGPADGVVLDETFPLDRQRELTGENHHITDWDHKLLATDEESALVLSVMLPLAGYSDTFRGLPVFYLYTYDRGLVTEDAYAFIYGQLVPFRDLEASKVYEDEDYVCYDASGWIYGDLEEHTRRFLEQNPDVRFDDAVRARVENYYSYYKAHMGELFYYK